jgi:hypothetical protein
MQIEMAERQKPWYQQASILISFFALLLSMISAIYTQIGQRSEEIRSYEEELRKVVERLLELREEFQIRLPASTPDPQQFEVASSFLNTKRSIYLAAAEFLTEKIPEHVSPQIYSILSNERFYDLDYSKAEEYALKAADASPTPLIKVTSLRNLILIRGR